jgi:hypothetical protein
MGKKEQNKKDESQIRTITLSRSKKIIPLVFYVNNRALAKLKELQGSVSIQLFEALIQLMSGFEENMQMAIADCLVDFAVNQNMCCTCIFTVDTVLENGYYAIALEKGYYNDEFVKGWHELIEYYY